MWLVRWSSYYSARAGQSAVRLKLELGSNIGTVLGEPKDIHSMIANLVGNGIDTCCSDQSEEKSLCVILRVSRKAAKPS